MQAIGPVLLLLSIPMMLRWIPQNQFFGFRIPSTLRDESVWYDANALSGRHFFALGLLLVMLGFVLPVSLRFQTVRMVALVGCVCIIAVDWRTANRWERQRNAGRERFETDH